MDDLLVVPDDDALRRWVSPTPDGDPRHIDASDATAAAWYGVVWGRLGRGDRAFAWWDGCDDPALQPWLLGERGRIVRELGLHTIARGYDEGGLVDATDLTDVVLLRLSLAADAVGEGNESGARRSLGTASSILDELDVDDRVRRQRLRRRWIEVEIALLAGGQPGADGLPAQGGREPTFPADYDAGTDFHRAKGLLFAGIAREDEGLLRQASALAPPALRWAAELARLDSGSEDAAGKAVEAWAQIVPPPAVATAVATTATAQRLRRLAGR